MDKIGKKFNSLEEADLAEDKYYAGLTPDERVSLLLELINQYRLSLNGAAERFERVFRVAPIEES